MKSSFASRYIPAIAIGVVFTIAAGYEIIRENGDEATQWQISLASHEESGERMVVNGIVFNEKNDAPISGAEVYVYHTDKDGYYNRENGSRGTRPRLKGTMLTNGGGRYEYHTIKPGPYPDSRIAAHVHYVVSARGFAERKLELVFEGDPYLSDRMRSDTKHPSGFFQIRELKKDEKGVLFCELNVALKPEE